VGEYNEDDDGNGFGTMDTLVGMMWDHAGLDGLPASDNNY
jgi:hypothetical protein